MSYRIPLFDLNFDEAEEQAVLECLRSRWISTGPRTERFEELFSEMMDGAHAVAMANCTVALHLALVLAGVGPGDEVICPSLTFVATANAVRYVGAVPVFADITGPSDLTMDPAEVERLVTPRTKAVIVMHYAGFPCAMDRILATARGHGLKVVEDACHAPLSEYRGARLGTLGDVGCFSFFSNKNLSTGEGGMLVTHDPALRDRARLLRSHGMTTMSYQRASGHSTAYDVIEHGYNYRMDDLRAAIGTVQLGKLRSDLGRRADVRKMYIEKLVGHRSVQVPFADHDGFVSNYIFPVLLPGADAGRRDRVRERLAAAGIQTSMHYPPVHRFSTYLPFTRSLPVTEQCADRLLTLPMYASLAADDVDFIARTLLEAADE